MGAENVRNQNNKYTIESIMRWLLFGVILVVAPPLFNVWYRIIVGFDVDFIEYIPDMLLVMLSVSCNLINTCVDSEKKIAYLLRWILGLFFGGISLGCWGLFFIVRFISIQEWYTNVYYMKLAKNLFYISSVVILVCAIIGSIVEVCTIAKNNSLEGNNEK